MGFFFGKALALDNILDQWAAVSVFLILKNK